MFSNKENINVLTSLMCLHGVKNVVVCPGSRNAAIVHNLNECKRMKCYPVTDERSAGFYAMGMILATGEPVAVCVTSGTALLNLAPVVAEAWYQHLPLVVISADRPQAWIGQQDGQTIMQTGALDRFVKCSVSLPEPHNEEEHWYCNRLVNEALVKMKRNGGGPVHINVPISEPLFEFKVKKLTSERKISYIPATINTEKVSRDMMNDFFAAKRPIIVIGQLPYRKDTKELISILETYAVVLRESLSPFDSVVPFDEALYEVSYDIERGPEFVPDFILYLGGTLVSKHIKNFLRQAKNAVCWTVSEDGDMHDTFMNLTGVIEADPYDVLSLLNNSILDGGKSDDTDASQIKLNLSVGFKSQWSDFIDMALLNIKDYSPEYSEMMAVEEFEWQLVNVDYDYKVHYANSMPVRLGNIYTNHYIYVNRGVNGIEGSLSTAAGFSVVSEDIIFCVIGDLSFFYDQNALWNQNLGANFRILLLNNSGGGIFHQMKGIKDSNVCDTMVAGSHQTNALGICEANNIDYMCAHNKEELENEMFTFLNVGTGRPLLFEVFTDADKDAIVYKKYYENMEKYRD